MHKYPILVFLALVYLCPSKAWAQAKEAPLSSKKAEYSHQYFFEGEERYNFVDTSANNLFWYHQLNLTLDDDYGSMPLLNMGGARQQFLAPQIHNIWDQQNFGPHNAYFSAPERVPYFQTRSPITEARYFQGYDAGQQFTLQHSQNVNPRWNVFVRMHRLNSTGFYPDAQNKMYNMLFSSHYTSKNGRYFAQAYISTEQLISQENGGLVDLNDVLNNDQPTRSLAPMRLLTGGANFNERVLANREFMYNHRYTLFKSGERRIKAEEPATALDSLSRDSTASAKNEIDSTRADDTTAAAASAQKTESSGSYLRLGHRFHYQRRYQTLEGHNFDFFENYFFTTQGVYKDSIRYRSLENSAYIETRLGNDSSSFDLMAGLKNALYRYSGPYFDFSNGSLGIISKVRGKYRDYLYLEGNLDLIFAGALASTFDFDVRSEAALPIGFKAYGSYRIVRRYPEFLQQTYFSNNFIWVNNFTPFTLNDITTGLRWGKRNFAEFKTYALGNWVYYDTDSRPQTAGSPVAYTQLQVRQDFNFWTWLHLDNRITWQQALSGGEFLPRPTWYTRNALYAEFSLFGNVLPTLVGTELNYFSRFRAPSYNPAIGRFYVANEQSIGGYPVLDFFVQFQLGKAYIFMKLEHANQGLSGNDFFVAPFYPINDRVFRLGVNWRFFN